VTIAVEWLRLGLVQPIGVSKFRKGTAVTTPVDTSWPSPPTVIPAVPSAQVPKKRHVWRWVLITLAVFGVGIVACTAALSHSISTSIKTSETAGLADVDGAHATLSAPDAIGAQYVNAQVTNHSSKASNYLITAAVESPDGKTQYDTSTLVVLRLAPGQTTQVKGIVAASSPIPADAVVRITGVIRTASV
jgi:hypothetical protein